MEVVRSRLARGGDSAGLAQFAEAAHADLETLAARIDALLALARPAGPPIDLYHTVRVLGVLYGAAIASEGGGALVVLPAPETPFETGGGLGAAAVRFAVASALETVAGEGGRWNAECGVARVEGRPSVFVRRATSGGRDQQASAFGLDNDVRAAVSEAGVRIIESTNELTIIFPPHEGVGLGKLANGDIQGSDRRR